MFTTGLRFETFLAFLLLAACGDDTHPDVGIPGDAGLVDASPHDASMDAPADALAPQDSGLVDASTDVPNYPDASAVVVRMATPWNGAVVAGGDPVFRTHPADAAVELEVCSDRDCSTRAEVVTGTPPLSLESALSPGGYFVRARALGGGAWSATFSFFVQREAEGAGMWLGGTDFNGDGYDEAMAYSPGGIDDPIFRVLDGSSTGPLAGGWSVRIGSSSFEDTRAKAVGDINGDGFIDLVIMRALPELYLGSSSGLPAEGTPVPIVDSTGYAPPYCGPGWAPLGDVDADGYADIAVTCGLPTDPFGDESILLLRGGPAGFEGSTTFAFADYGETTDHFGGFDVNGDGFADVIVSNETMMLGSEAGLGNAETVAVRCNLFEGAGDYDGDGDVDLLGRGVVREDDTCDFDAMRYFAWRSPTLEEQAGGMAFESTGLGDIVHMAGGGDLDGDGASDVAFVLQRFIAVGNIPTIAFALTGSAPVDLGSIPGRGHQVGVGDLNGDGYSDLIYSSGTTDIYWVPGSPTGLQQDEGAVVMGTQSE